MDKKDKQIPAFRGSKTQVLERGQLPDTPIATIDQYLKDLKAQQHEWAQSYPMAKRIKLLEAVLKNIDTCKEEWVEHDLHARHIPKGHWGMPDSDLVVGLAARVVRVHLEVLKHMDKKDLSRPFAKVKEVGERVVVETYPLTLKEKLLLPGFRGEVHMAPDCYKKDVTELQAQTYKDKTYEGGVSLILGAGNVASLTMSDMVHKLIVQKNVVIVKIHPVLEYLGPLFQKIFEPFIAAGFVRIVNGGSKEGQHLVSHPLIDDIHITGSDKTFEAIVYGSGDEGLKNKQMDHRITTKPVTGELGNVTPVIVIPGDWKESDFDFQAENIMAMLATYNGYTCTTPRVLILPKFWAGSLKLLEKLQVKMSKLTAPVNYYPGTSETVLEAVSCYPHMARFGTLDKKTQPWMIAKNLDAHAAEQAFNREFWAAFISQTYIDGANAEDFLMKAVHFSNEKLWGTLSSVIIVDPKTEKAMRASKALPKAIQRLRYGTVAINMSPGLSLVMGRTPWGGYPGATYSDIQSGNGFVYNPLMLDKVEKSVVYSPFRIIPRPLWFINEKPNLNASRALVDFLIHNRLKDFGRVVWAALRG